MRQEQLNKMYREMKKNYRKPNKTGQSIPICAASEVLLLTVDCGLYTGAIATSTARSDEAGATK
jgi:hypothetical protein